MSSRRWIAHLWREWTVESWRAIAPAFAKPRPNEWPDDRLTAAWLGHSTVLLNFFGVTILTDPVLLSRIGIPLGFTAIGPKRLTKPALEIGELPPADAQNIQTVSFGAEMPADPASNEEAWAKNRRAEIGVVR